MHNHHKRQGKASYIIWHHYHSYWYFWDNTMLSTWMDHQGRAISGVGCILGMDEQWFICTCTATLNTDYKIIIKFSNLNNGHSSKLYINECTVIKKWSLSWRSNTPYSLLLHNAALLQNRFYPVQSLFQPIAGRCWTLTYTLLLLILEKKGGLIGAAWMKAATHTNITSDLDLLESGLLIDTFIVMLIGIVVVSSFLCRWHAVVCDNGPFQQWLDGWSSAYWIVCLWN